MQLGEAQKGFSSKSKLFDSLKFYLDNKDRLQPIIGLGSIIECVKADTYNREALYMCEVCVCRLSKADMRNHIMGSLHRYNYIKTCHPHLISRWKENSDFSQLAWPLMDLAKVLEREEGPGDVQLLEVEDDVYQKMATCCENDAITLISFLKDGQRNGEPESYPETAAVHFDHYPNQSQRIVLPAQNQWRRSEKSSKADMASHHFTTSHPLQPTVASPVKSNGWLRNLLTSEFDNTQVLSEPSVSGSSNCFLDGYTGTKPLIGLFRVVECRGEDGCTYCFLCHCCRIRSNKKEIINHLTSSSHLINYLMETYPEQMEAMMAAVNDNSEFLLSLAKKVEQEEGRGELKVVNAPESLCILLTGKSYHWCIKMLCNGYADTNSQPKKVAMKGPSMNTTSVEGWPEKHDLVLSKWAQKMTTKRKKKRVTDTLFKVSLPLTKGAVLLERTSFSEDNLPVSCAPSADQHLIPSPESQTEDFEMDSDTGSFAVNHTECTSVCENKQLQQDLYNEDGGTGQYMEPERNLRVTLHQEMDGYYCDNEYFSQSEHVTGTRDQKVYAERNYNRQHGSQERPSTSFDKNLKNEGLKTQNERLCPAVSHTQGWTSYKSSYAGKEGYAEQWYNAESLSKTGTGVEVSNEEGQMEMNSDATPHYYQRKPQYMAKDHASFVPGSVGHSSLSGELVPNLDAVRVSMYPFLGDCHAYTAPAPRTQIHEIEQRQLQTYMEPNVPSAPQSYITQPMTCQAVQVGYRVMGDPNYNIRPGANNYQSFPLPDSGGTGVGAMFQSNSYIPPRQAPFHGAHSDVNFRASALSGLMFSRSDNEIVQFMHCNSQFEFCK